MPHKAIFILGASGFVGGHLVELLAETHSDFQLYCLLRNPTVERIAELKNLNPMCEVVEGTLEDHEIISKKAQEVDIVIHIAHSDHMPSVKAVLEGLTIQMADNKAAEPPIYLHMSGCGILGDNSMGEKVDNIKEWTDVDLRLDEHISTIVPKLYQIIEAATRDENRIRASILAPGLIYGVGKARRSSGWLPLYVTLAKKAGHSGTWGPGENTMNAIHVRDVATAVVCVLDALLEGKITGNKDELFIITSNIPMMSWREINSIMGDVMFERGLVREPGVKPFPSEIIEPYGHYGWSLLASNAHGRADRLQRLGWEPKWSKRETLRDMVPKMMEIGVPQKSA